MFAAHTCLVCYAVDGNMEMLGDNLKDVGRRLSREKILEKILEPFNRIKPSMMAIRVIKKTGRC